MQYCYTLAWFTKIILEEYMIDEAIETIGFIEV